MNDYLYNTKMKLINGQMIALLLFIITLFISLLIAYNEKLNLEKKTSLFDDQEVLNIAIINKIIVTILGIYFVYTNYIEKELNNKDNIPLIASIITLIAYLVSLYDLLRNYQKKDDNINNIELPIL